MMPLRPRPTNRRRANATARPAKVLLAVAIAVLAVSATAAIPTSPASAQGSTGPTPVNSCTTVDTPGRYVITRDIESTISSDDQSCITVTADNVVLDGGGHILTGSGAGHGIEVDHTANVTVRRVQANEWTVGVFYLASNNGTVRNTIANDTTSGVALAASSDNAVVDVTAFDNAIGVAVGGDSHHNRVRNAVAVENKWGIHFERESANNTVKNSVSRNNSKWDYYAMRDTGTNRVSNLELSTATLSFTERNVALRAPDSVPALPSGTRSQDSFVEAFATPGNSSLSVTMNYDSAGTGTLWRATGGSWSRVSGASTDAAASSVSANGLTQFGTFGVLRGGGNGGPVTVTASKAPSVQRTLTTTAPPTAAPTDSGTQSAAGTTMAGPANGNATAGAPNGTASNGTAPTGAAGTGTAVDDTGGAGSQNGAGSGSKPNESGSSGPTSNGTGGSATQSGANQSGAARGESGAFTGLPPSGIGVTRLALAAVGLLALVVIAVALARRRRGPNSGI